MILGFLLIVKKKEWCPMYDIQLNNQQYNLFSHNISVSYNDVTLVLQALARLENFHTYLTDMIFICELISYLNIHDNTQEMPYFIFFPQNLFFFLWCQSGVAGPCQTGGFLPTWLKFLSQVSKFYIQYTCRYNIYIFSG